MASRLPALAPRLALVAVVALVATTGITYAAEQSAVPAHSPAGAAAQPSKPAVLVVPDVRRQAFVFAKGSLQDAGFSWRVAGPVKGYAANVVADQSPAAGTRVVDTGAPLVTLSLRRNSKYAQAGEPEEASPYLPTAVRLVGARAATLLAPAAAKPQATAKPAAKPAAPKPAAAPAAPKPVASKPVASKPVASKPRYPQSRPVAFAVAGAPKEPLDEMPLPDRARALGAWIAGRPQPTSANVRRWLYQNAWIVSGARLGWWRGAEALQILVDVDRRTEALWGVGAKSEAVALRALSEVRARSR